jgi:hypothetical protein
MSHGPQNLLSDVNRLMQTAIGRDWQLYSMLLAHWQEIVGAEWAAHARPVKLIFLNRAQRSEGVLTILLPRGLTMEMQFRQPQILARMNRFFGQPLITRLQLLHDSEQTAVPLPLPPLPDEQRAAVVAQTDSIADPELREALAALGCVIKQDAMLENQNRE